MSNTQTLGSGMSPPPSNSFVAGSVSTNNSNGLTVSTVGTTTTYNLTNRSSGNSPTVGAASTTVTSFTPPLTKGIYKLFIEIAAWDDANSTGSTYELQGAVKADGLGGLATVGTPVRIMNGDSSVFDVTQVDVSTGGGIINVTATGIAGRTIKWTGLLQYVFGGA